MRYLQPKRTRECINECSVTQLVSNLQQSKTYHWNISYQLQPNFYVSNAMLNIWTLKNVNVLKKVPQEHLTTRTSDASFELSQCVKHAIIEIRTRNINKVQHDQLFLIAVQEQSTAQSIRIWKQFIPTTAVLLRSQRVAEFHNPVEC